MRSDLGPPIPDRNFVAVVRALGALALIGASVALAVAQMVNGHLDNFISANTLLSPGRKVLLSSLALGAASGMALAGALYWRRRTVGGLARMLWAARFLAPLALAALLPGLLVNEAWPDSLKLLVSLSVFLFGLEPLLRLHFSTYPDPWASAATSGTEAAWSSSPLTSAGGGATVLPAPAPVWWARLQQRVRSWRHDVPSGIRRRVPAFTIAAMALFYIGYMAFFTVRNHHRFNTFTWDLGQIDNQFFNFLHGHPFRCTALIREGNWSELRNHAEATMFFLLPIYAVAPRAETLLVLQAVLLGLAGVFIYRIAARRLPPATALVVAGAYYLYPPLHGAQFFDIHFQPVAAGFMLAAIDCFEMRRMRWFAVLFGLTILCREDISVGTAVFGLFLMLTGHRARVGLVVFVISVAYFILLRFVIMPAVGSWGFAEHYKHLFPAGEGSFKGIVRTIVTNPVFTFTTLLTPEKLRYLLQIVAPLAFLPLRRIHLALSILPGAYFTLLTTGYGPTLDIGYQYSGYFLPYIFPAAALALAGMSRRYPGWAGLVRRRSAVTALVVATLITTTHWGAIPPRPSFHSSYGAVQFAPPTAQDIQRRRDIHEVMRLVPPDAILAVSDREMPHVSNRTECWNISLGTTGADYVLYGKVNPISVDTVQYEAALRAGYIKIAERPAVALLKRPGAR